MTDTAKKYLQYERAILLGRARGTLVEEEEDRLVDQMDEFWFAMTCEERQDADRRAREIQVVKAPQAGFHVADFSSMAHLQDAAVPADDFLPPTVTEAQAQRKN